MALLSANRITKQRDAVHERFAAFDAELQAGLDDNLAITFEEHFTFQNMQVQAHVAGILTADEAQLVYIALGEVGSIDNGGWSAGTSTVMKVVVTKLMHELLDRKLAA